MSRRFGWAPLMLGVGLAAVGGVVAYVLHGGPWAGLGAAIGAVAGAFAPTLYDGMRRQREARQSRQAAAEQPPAESRARLLDPRLEVVGFIGRQAELAALLAWCEDEQAGRLRLVTGSGGVGKTRLAVELAKRMTMTGWKCERVAHGKENEIIGLLAVTRRRALLVVDYAETRIGLGQMLTALAGDQGKGLKVLLLARSAGDWWDQLGVAQPEVWDLLQVAKSAELVLLPVVAADLSDADVITQAVASFASYLGVPERTVEIYGDRARRRVLDLHAVALVAVLANCQPSTETGHDGASSIGENFQYVFKGAPRADGATSPRERLIRQWEPDDVRVAWRAGALRAQETAAWCGHSAFAPSAHGGRPPVGSPAHRPCQLSPSRSRRARDRGEGPSSLALQS